MAFEQSHTWRIKVSSFDHLDVGEFITSRRFIVVKDHVSYMWYMKLYRKDKTWPTWLSVSFVYLSGPRESIFISNSYTSEQKTAPLQANSSSGKEYKIGSEFFAAYILEANLAKFFEAPDAANNQYLTFTANIVLQPDLFTNLPFPDVVEPVQYHTFDRLLLKVLSGEEDKLSDFSIIAGEHIYATDRRILASRCQFFEQFFVEGAEDWVEKEQKQFSAPVRMEAMNEILTFMYTGRVNIPHKGTIVDIDLVQELVCGADYFRMVELKKHYEKPLFEYLFANSTGKNGLFFLIFADRYDFKLLKSCALSVLNTQYDEIEQHVISSLSTPTEKNNESETEQEDEILAMWKTIKQSSPDNISLFDELFSYMRLMNVSQL